MLRSQDGVEEVEDSYGNLKQGLIKVKIRKDKTIDLVRLVDLLEKEVGFEPVTEVTVELRGRLVRREHKLFIEVSETGQTFAVEKIEAKGSGPPEGQLLTAVAALADPHSTNRLVIRRWSE